MDQSKTKKEKMKKKYEEFDNIADSILSPSNIMYDLIELVPYGNEFFGIKIFIENASTYIIEFDKEDYIKFLKDTKKELLKNPYQCPFCRKRYPEKVCPDCGTIFIESLSLSGFKDRLVSYSGFTQFSEEIEKNTGIPKDVIKIYCNFEADIKDIVSGVDVIYKGLNTYPVFCLSKNISKKDFNSLNKISLQKLIFSYIASKCYNYDVIEHQVGFDFSDTELMLGFYNLKQNINGIIYFESNFYSQEVKIGINFDIKKYIENYFKENNLDLNKFDDFFDDFYDYFCEKIMDYNCFDEMIGHDNYITCNVENEFYFNIEEIKTDFDIEYLKKHLDVKLDKYVDKIIESIKETFFAFINNIDNK